LEDVAGRLQVALAVARELGALRSELSAAITMARVVRDAGRSDDTRTALAPVYAKFTEGFGTPLLVEARTLLSELE